MKDLSSVKKPTVKDSLLIEEFSLLLRVYFVVAKPIEVVVMAVPYSWAALYLQQLVVVHSCLNF